MCGRYASTRSATDLSTLFEALDETEGELRPDYNVAPTDPVPIVRRSARAASSVLSVARWGLVPAWSRDATGVASMINARAETVATSRAFATSFASRRCLVPADGWYEWVRVGGQGRGANKQPYFMTRGGAEVLALGGIWTMWASGSTRLLTFSVVTLPAEGHLALVHDRMPLVLEPDRWDAWLSSPEASGLLAGPPPQYAAGIELRPVSAAVGDVRNDGPGLIQKVPGSSARNLAEAPAPLSLRSIMEPPDTLF